MDDFLEFVNFVDEFMEDDVIRIPRKYIRNMEDQFEKYSENQFFKQYRFPKNVVLNKIMGLLNFDYTNNRGLPVPPTLKLLTTLQFYAASDFQVSYNILYMNRK